MDKIKTLEVPHIPRSFHFVLGFAQRICTKFKTFPLHHRPRERAAARGVERRRVSDCSSVWSPKWRRTTTAVVGQRNCTDCSSIRQSSTDWQTAAVAAAPKLTFVEAMGVEAVAWLVRSVRMGTMDRSTRPTIRQAE